MLLNRWLINLGILNGTSGSTSPTLSVGASAVLQKTEVKVVAAGAQLVVRTVLSTTGAAVLRKTVALTVGASVVCQGSAPVEVIFGGVTPILGVTLTGVVAVLNEVVDISPALSVALTDIVLGHETALGDLENRLTVSEELILGGVVVPYIEPQTDAILKITVKDTAGVAVTDAVATATAVYSPAGASVATNVTMPHQGAGVYHLSISRTWSDNSGKAIEGEFVAEIKVTRGGVERRRRFRYPVKFDDED